MSSRSQCEICQQPFQLLFSRNCIFSCANGIKQLKLYKNLLIVYLIFCVATFVYIGYCSYMESVHALNNDLQLILLVIGICLIIIMLGIGLKWCISSLWRKVVILEGIGTLNQNNSSRREFEENEITVDQF